MDYLRIAFKTKAEHDKYIKHQAKLLGITEDESYVSASSLISRENVMEKKKYRYNKKVANGFQKWTVEDDEFIVKNYATMSHGKMAKVLGRSAMSVGSRIFILRNAGQINIKKDLHGNIIRETV